MLNVDLRHDFSRYYYVSQNDLNLEYVKKLYKEMEAEGSLLMEKENVPENQRVLLRTMRLRYYGQFRDLEVSWPSGAITKRAIAEGIANFHHKHESLYGFTFENYPVEFVRFGLTTIGKMPKITLRKIKRGTEDASSALKGERRACFEEINGFVKTKVYNGDELCSGNVLDGPCIVEEKMTSIVIPPNFKMRVDEYGNYTTVK
jgi:N-methylhydantoinase A